MRCPSSLPELYPAGRFFAQTFASRANVTASPLRAASRSHGFGMTWPPMPDGAPLAPPDDDAGDRERRDDEPHEAHEHLHGETEHLRHVQPVEPRGEDLTIGFCVWRNETLQLAGIGVEEDARRAALALVLGASDQVLIDAMLAIEK